MMLFVVVARVVLAVVAGLFRALFWLMSAPFRFVIWCCGLADNDDDSDIRS